MAWKKGWDEGTNRAYYKYVKGELNAELQVGEMNRINKQWGVVLFTEKGKKVLLEDKTKAQALAFAKSYMRSH